MEQESSERVAIREQLRQVEEALVVLDRGTRVAPIEPTDPRRGALHNMILTLRRMLEETP